MKEEWMVLCTACHNFPYSYSYENNEQERATITNMDLAIQEYGHNMLIIIQVFVYRLMEETWTKTFVNILTRLSFSTQYFMAL
ncbi:MAG: hypothetical protein WCA79_19095 [Anaerolineales bacterium]